MEKHSLRKGQPTTKAKKNPERGSQHSVAVEKLTLTDTGGKITQPCGSTDSVLTSMSSFDLLKNQNVLHTGMKLLLSLSSKTMNPEEVSKKMGLPFTAVTEISKENQGDEDKNGRSLRSGKITQSTKSCTTTDYSKRKTKTTNSAQVHDMITGDIKEVNEANGEAMLRELTSRYQEGKRKGYGDQDKKHSKKDGFMRNLIPDYQLKLETYKLHSKKIEGMSFGRLMRKFKAIEPDIVGISEGIIFSKRHCIYTTDAAGSRAEKMRSLMELNVSLPFSNEQGMHLIKYIYDALFPDTTKRVQYVQYVNFVMLPEVFIRIFALVNHISYEAAEIEMRSGACYDGPIADSKSTTLTELPN